MAIEMENQAQEDLHARLSSYLRQALGELAEPNDDGPFFYVALAHVPILVGAYPAGPDAAAIDISAFPGPDIAVTEEVMRFLLEKNATLRFGAFLLDEEGAIRFDHSLLGETTTKDSLALILRSMAATADEVHDQLTMQFK